MIEAESGQYDPMRDPAARPLQLSAKVALLLGFGGVIILMAIAGIDATRVLRQIEGRHAEITRLYLSRHHTLERISSWLYFSGTLVRDYLLQPDSERASVHRADMQKLREQMETAVRNYVATTSPEQKPAVQQLKTELDSYWRNLSPILRWTPAERKARAGAFLLSEVFPRRAAMLEVANRIDSINEQALNAEDKRSAQLFADFRRRTITILVLTCGIGLLLATTSILHTLRLEREARFRYQEIQRARGALERLSAKLVQAQEEERRAIARELHDEIGQSLSALLVDLGNLNAIAPYSESQEARVLLATIKSLAEENLRSVRNMALLLRPSMLDDFGLAPALHWQARETSRRTGMRVSVAADDVADQLPDEHKVCVYRVVQEALHNCAQHAKAQAVRVVVTQKEDRLLLTVQDDGRGFDPIKTRGLGLLGIEERVKHLGGSFRVESQPGHGALLIVELSLKRAMADALQVAVT